ncbi:MAG: hypothetical protein ACOX40_06175 [Bacilli bacterium]|jgi:hypothetical protein|nr:hypothetical protein [Acholeplasmataceae bacterium]
MNYEKILKKVEENKLDPQEAFEKLYVKEVVLPKARFVKLKINILDSPGTTAFLKVLFCLPLPIFFVKSLVKLARKDMGDETYELVSELLGYAKGASVMVDSDEIKVDIKVS